MTRKKALWLLLSISAAMLIVVAGALILFIQLQEKGGGSVSGATAHTASSDQKQRNDQNHQISTELEKSLAALDRTDRDAVAILAAQILSTWDPSIDQSESSAVARAKDLIDPKVVELNSQGTRPADNALWMEMREAKAVTKPFVEIQDDAHAIAERPNPDALTVLSTWDWLGPKTRTTNPETRMFFMQMRKNDADQWEVGDYTYTDVPTRYLVGTLE